MQVQTSCCFTFTYPLLAHFSQFSMQPSLFTVEQKTISYKLQWCTYTYDWLLSWDGQYALDKTSAAAGSSTSDRSDSDTGKWTLSLLIGVEVVTEVKRVHCTLASFMWCFASTWIPTVVHVLLLIYDNYYKHLFRPLVLVFGLTWMRAFILEGEVCVPASCVPAYCTPASCVLDSAPASVSIALLDGPMSISRSSINCHRRKRDLS